MQVSVTIVLSEGDEMPDADATAHNILKAVGGDPDKDQASVFINTPPIQASAGTAPPLP